ncbi:hypothetical protein LCGC14_2130360 [marine sediment metagenome]|uniref:Uncharacterized protein n=1 Tax=marine sediment metagenome TaxID=412755 RepID=A0A0F9GEP3_9ZZZZ
MIKNIHIVKKDVSMLGKILSIEFEEDKKTYTRKIDDNLAIEIIEVLCKALCKPFPKDYKFEK